MTNITDGNRNMSYPRSPNYNVGFHLVVQVAVHFFCHFVARRLVLNSTLKLGDRGVNTNTPEQPLVCQHGPPATCNCPFFLSTTGTPNCQKIVAQWLRFEKNADAVESVRTGALESVLADALESALSRVCGRSQELARRRSQERP